MSVADAAGDLLARLGVDPGLCGHCVHRELLASKRSAFLRCGLAATDPRFARYPPLPVVRCAGFVERPAGTPRAESP
jgi:hypothetical protein